MKQNPQYSTYVEHGLFAGHDTNYYHELSEIDFLKWMQNASLLPLRFAYRKSRLRNSNFKTTSVFFSIQLVLLKVI